MSQNTHRLTESHFKRHEHIIADMLCGDSTWTHSETVRAGTLANNLNFAVKWFLENPECASELFDRPTVLAFRHKWVITPHKTDMHAVVLRERISVGKMRPVFKSSVTVPKTEGMRVEQLRLDIADLALYRSVLTCIRHAIIAWPIPFRGEPLQVHFDYLAEVAPELCDIEYNTDTDTTVLVPQTL